MTSLHSYIQKHISRKYLHIYPIFFSIEVETPETIETNEDAEKGIADLTAKVQSLRQDLKEQKKSADAEEKKYQQIVDESRIALVS